MKQDLNNTIFNYTVLLKLFDGILGTLAGITVYFVKKDRVINLIYWLFQHELTEDPTDFFINKVFSWLNILSLSTQTFIAFYLFINGILKIFLMIMLLRNKLWAYPVTGYALIFMVIYQIFRIFYSYSWLLICLTLIDLVIIYLIFDKYKKLLPLMKKS